MSRNLDEPNTAGFTAGIENTAKLDGEKSSINADMLEG